MANGNVKAKGKKQKQKQQQREKTTNQSTKVGSVGGDEEASMRAIALTLCWSAGVELLEKVKPELKRSHETAPFLFHVLLPIEHRNAQGPRWAYITTVCVRAFCVCE